MKIKDMFWKLFWLMLRGKGNARILFDSEAVQFKAHMIEVTKAHFNPEEGGGLGEYLSLHWDANIDQYLRIIGDIDDLQSIIKHINDEDEVLELQYKVNQVNNSRLDSLLKSKNEKLMKNMRHFNKEESEAYNKLYKSKSKVIKKDVFVGVNLDVKFDAKKYIDLA